MPGTPKIIIKGEEEMLAKLQEIARKYPKKIGASIYRQAEKIMTKSKRDFVPVDTGALRSTGMVEGPETKGKNIKVTLSYGGPAAPYATDQHEELSYVHTVGGPKYLERPLNEAVPKIAAEIAKDLK